MSAFKPRGSGKATLGKVSNRERMRQAQRAVIDMHAAELRTKMLLAQAGGEVIISKGTIAQVVQSTSTIETLPNPKAEGEVIIRLLMVDASEGLTAAEQEREFVKADGLV